MYRSGVRILREEATKNREHFGDNHVKKIGKKYQMSKRVKKKKYKKIFLSLYNI